MTQPICKVARWRCAPDRLAATQAANREFVQARSSERGTRLYASFQDGADPTRFLNVMIFESPMAEAKHRSSAAVKRFVDVIYPAAVEEVAFTDLRLVASTIEEQERQTMASAFRFRGRIRYFRPELRSGLAVIDIPKAAATGLGGLKQMKVRGRLNGTDFTSNTMPAGGGVLALSVSQALLKAAGLKVGDKTEVELLRRAE